MMQRIQSIFNRLAGFANFEAERLPRAEPSSLKPIAGNT
jgi:hypothetical protein